MSLHVEEWYPNGIPQTAVSGFAPRGLAWHWTAGGTGRAGAESTVRHFQNTRYTVNASYHLLVWVEHGPNHVGCHTYAVWIVRSTVASHSMNPSNAFKPKTGSALEQARFAEVHRILARDSDPNADCISISYCGMPADLARDLVCATFRNDLQELARQLIAHPAVIDRPHFGHGWIQPLTRYEMDSVGLDFIGMLYDSAAPAPVPEEEDMANWVANMKPALFRATILKGVPMRSGPGSNYPGFTLGDSGRTITFIGEVPDEGGGSIPYIVYVLGAGGLSCTRKDNIEPGSVVELGVPIVKTVEVVKEVPTGITETDLINAANKAAEGERERIAQSEADRIRNT